MATKATTVVREIPLPIERVREITVSEEFLLRLDGDDASMRLRDGHREVHEDGSMDATVTAVVGEGDKELEMVQRMEVSEVREDGSFSIFTSVPLYLAEMTRSPTFRYIFTSLPSTSPPGPTATTRAIWGFS